MFKRNMEHIALRYRQKPQEFSGLSPYNLKYYKTIREKGKQKPIVFKEEEKELKITRTSFLNETPEGMENTDMLINMETYFLKQRKKQPHHRISMRTQTPARIC